MSSDHGLQVVASASSSQDLLAAVVQVPIDVAVISYSLDDQPARGTEVLREMRALRPQVKGVLLLDSSRPQDVLKCFRAGAKGIFSKQERLESLCKCIHCVHEGQIWARSVELELALDAFANSPLVRATNYKGIELLSARERQVTQYLAAGMANREIADSLGLSPHTIKNYLFRIFDKLGVSSRTELLYLTMNNPQSRVEDSHKAEGVRFPALLEAAEAGLPWAQLRLAEHYGQANNRESDPVAAYMWYLVSEKSMATIRNQVDGGKKHLSQTMCSQQLAEGERRATEWLKNNRKRSGFAIAGEQPEKKMVAGIF
jgi:DNA-binding NarL/FixJ family response regulator